jgi:hypothetical protein
MPAAQSSLSTMVTIHWPSRFRAATIHLVFSLAVAALAAGLVFTLWYPWPYRIVSGGTELFALLVSVDAVIGPLITLAVFDRLKPSATLRRDLIVVVLLQLAALAYGLHTTFIARPVVLALEGQRFRATTALEVAETELPEAPASLRSLPIDGPRVVRAVSPSEGSAKFEAIQAALGGVDVGMRPKFWRVWDAEGQREALANAKPLPALLASKKASRSEVDDAIRRSGKSADSLLYLPLLARRLDWVVLLDAQTGQIAGFAPLDGL